MTRASARPLTGEELEWVLRHRPVDALSPGDRLEVGLARDRAWAALLGRIRSGTALAVDYGHTRATAPPGGTLVGYRNGALVRPVPDGSCDVTAHVAVDSLAQDERRTQREAVRELLGPVPAPDTDLARTDPPGYLAALARRSALGALTAPEGLGGFWWVLARVGRT